MATSAHPHSQSASVPPTGQKCYISIPQITIEQRKKVGEMLSTAAGGNAVFCDKDPEEYTVKFNDTSRLGESSVTALNACTHPASQLPLPRRILHWTQAQPSLSGDTFTRDLGAGSGLLYYANDKSRVPDLKGSNTTVHHLNGVSIYAETLSVPGKPVTDCIKLVDAAGSTQRYKVFSVESRVAGPWTFRLYDIKGISYSKGQLTALNVNAGSEAGLDSDSASEDDRPKPVERHRRYMAESDEED